MSIIVTIKCVKILIKWVCKYKKPIACKMIVDINMN